VEESNQKHAQSRKQSERLTGQIEMLTGQMEALTARAAAAEAKAAAAEEDRQATARRLVRQMAPNNCKFTPISIDFKTQQKPSFYLL
jgi:phage shock protein A